MEIYHKMMTRALIYYGGRAFFTFLLMVVGVIILFWLKKEKILPKWAISIILVVFIVISCGITYEIINIYLDRENCSYITYYGNYRQINEGYDSSFQTTILLDGKKKTLSSHYSITNNGDYVGYVVYGKRSDIVVYVGDTEPQY